jgi:hypothetical protein
MIRSTKQSKVSAVSTTFVTHVVSVSLADLLGEIDATDGQVVVEIETPSGRSQRVTIRPNLMVPQHHADADIHPWDK